MSISEISVLDRARIYSTEKFVPLQASLELTNRCNERCTHCYIDDFKDDPSRVLDFEGWKRVLDELREAGTMFVILMGGEPMLAKHFWEVAEYSVKKGFHTSLISNGTLIRSREVADRLARIGIANLTFSYYSMQADVHDVMTSVAGSHAKTTRAIELCLQAGLDVSVNCLLTHENINGVFQIEDFCLDRNIPLKIDPMVTPKLSGDINPTFLRPSYSQLEWFYRERAKRWKKGLPMPTLESSGSYVCNAAKGKCAVTSSGDLLPCIEIREAIGNLVQESFSDIWSSETAMAWRHFYIKDLKDYPLKDGKSFCDHCPGMAKNEDGDPYQVSRYAIRLAEIKRRVFSEFGGKDAE